MGSELTTRITTGAKKINATERIRTHHLQPLKSSRPFSRTITITSLHGQFTLLYFVLNTLLFHMVFADYITNYQFESQCVFLYPKDKTVLCNALLVTDKLDITNCHHVDKISNVNNCADNLKHFRDVVFREFSIETQYYENDLSWLTWPKGNAKPVSTRLIFKYSPRSSSLSDITKPFLNPEYFNIIQLTLRGFKLTQDANLADTIMAQNSPHVVYTNIETTGDLPKDIFNVQRISSFREIYLVDSSIDKIGRYAFTLDRRVSKMHIRNIVLKQSMAPFSIIYDLSAGLELSSSDTIELSISDSKLKPAQLSQNFLQFQNFSQTPVKIYLNLRGNFFASEAPEAFLKQMVKQIWTLPQVTMTIELDPITCCSDSNKWLGEYLPDHWRNVTSFVKVQCEDLGLQFNDLLNKTELSSSCSQQRTKTYTILSVVIIAILILSAILATVSFVCIYYILPKKVNIIKITTAKTAKNSSGFDPSEPSGYSKTDRSKETSLLQVNSSQTETDPKLVEFSEKKPQKSLRGTESGVKRVSIGETRQSDHKSPGNTHTGKVLSNTHSLKLPKFTAKLPKLKSPLAKKIHRHQEGRETKPHKSPISAHKSTGDKKAHQARNRKSPRSPILEAARSPSNQHHTISRSTPEVGAKATKSPVGGKHASQGLLQTGSNRSDITGMSQALKTSIP